MLSAQQTQRVQITDRLDDLASRVRRLVPSHRDPERYHVEKSEIENDLRQMSRELSA